MKNDEDRTSIALYAFSKDKTTSSSGARVKELHYRQMHQIKNICMYTLQE